MLELKTRLETKLREELSHGSEAQASPFFPQQLFAGASSSARNCLPRVVMGWKRTRGGQNINTA